MAGRSWYMVRTNYCIVRSYYMAGTNYYTQETSFHAIGTSYPCLVVLETNSSLVATNHLLEVALN